LETQRSKLTRFECGGATNWLKMNETVIEEWTLRRIDLILKSQN